MEIKFCDICQKKIATDTHHLIGGSTRMKCDEDNLVLEICRGCHSQLHNSTAMNLSKMLGQALWERWYLSDFGDAEESMRLARAHFIERYGKSWL